jgi:hypothetical protein
MDAFDILLNCSGTWQGHNRVQVEATDPIHESPSQLTVTPLLKDTFIRLDQTWSWKNEPQSGSMLIGYNRKSNEATIHWIDTWHNGTRVMPLTGSFDPQGILIARGSFPVAEGPDWGWRIQIHTEAEHLKIAMFCMNPQTNQADGGVWSDFVRT